MRDASLYKINQIRCFEISKKDSLSIRDIIELFRWTREADTDYVEIANSVINGAGNYLDSSCISQIVRADITDAQASLEITKQKAFFERATYILPEILRHLKCTKDSLFGAIMQIDDIHHDFDVVSQSDRQDKEKRKIVECMRSCIEASDRLSKILDQLHYQARADFEYAVTAIAKLNNTDSQKPYIIENFAKQLNTIQSSVELSLNKSIADDSYLHLTANQAKTFVVENVYHLSISSNGPKLLTTPGSDFSMLCSLILELVSGKAHESLAGAINRFARSSRKKQIDMEEAERQAENELGDDEVDNFCHEKKQIANCLRSIDSLENLSANADLSDQAHSLVAKLIKYEKIMMDEASHRYGPNIIWAHQMPLSYYEKFHDKDTEYKAKSQKLKSLEIELGRLRRVVRMN